MGGASELQQMPIRFQKLGREGLPHWGERECALAPGEYLRRCLQQVARGLGAAKTASKPLIVVAVCKRGEHRSVATGEMAKEVLNDHPEAGVVELDHLCRRFWSPNGCPFNGCAHCNVTIRSQLREDAKHKAMIMFRKCFE